MANVVKKEVEAPVERQAQLMSSYNDVVKGEMYG